ncbi:hypothetical protein ACL598_12360 [Bordetella bronchialis]|uniref:hypothetical protein n=1 Tax=Bordetella bronchialis TaxID=463025 RepID=UPI003D08DE85
MRLPFRRAVRDAVGAMTACGRLYTPIPEMPPCTPATPPSRNDRPVSRSLVMVRARTALSPRAAMACVLLAMMPTAASASQSEIFLDPAPETQGMAPPQAYPSVQGRVLGYVENANFFGVKGPGATGLPSSWHTVDPFLQGAAVARLSPRWTLSGLAELRAFGNDPGDRAFETLDGQLRNLFLSYDAGAVSYFAGKFEVGLGEAWESMDGIYSGFSGDYAYPGSLGAGARWSLRRSDSASHTVTAIVFKRDNTTLGQTWFNNYPSQPDSADGGPANTPGLQSGGIAYDIGNIPGLDGLRAGATVARLGAGQGDARSQTALEAHINYERPLGDGMGLRLFAEAVHMRGFLGRQAAATDTIAAVSLSAGRWLYTIAAAQRNLQALSGSLSTQGFSDSRDWGVSGTVAYQTDIGVIVQAGLLRQQEQGVTFNQGLLRFIFQTSL